MLQRARLLNSIVFGVAMAVPAAAQQTIFNVPSADVAPPRALFLQHESQSRVWNPDRFWIGTHYAAIGIGHYTELDATLFNLSAPGSDNVVLGLGFKTSLPILTRYSSREFKLTVGQMIPISLQDGGVGSWTYAHISGRLPGSNTRITAGASAGTKQIFGSSVLVFVGGIEQPISGRFSAIADWYSGVHANGFLIPGFSYVLGKGFTAYLGFQIPNNSSSGRSGVVFELAFVRTP